MPAQHLRRIIQDHADMSKREANADKRSYLGALKFLPFAIFKLLENMPEPWQAAKKVKVLYHVAGALTIVDEIPKVIPPVYYAQWGAMWTAMRKEKANRRRFKRLNIPAFDDEEPFLNWTEHLAEAEVPEPITGESSSEWLSKDTDRAKKYTLNLAEMTELAELAKPLNARRQHFDDSALLTAKSLNIALPNGPKFEPLYRDIDASDYGEFNSVDKIITRNPLTSEAQVYYPFLNNCRPRAVNVSKYQEPIPQVRRINDDFSSSKPLNPISVSSKQFKGPEKPFLDDFTIPRTQVAEALNIHASKFPFNTMKGSKKRAEDMALVKNWYLSKPKRNYPTKTRASYQKLLKRHVKTLIRSHNERKQTHEKRNLLKNLGKTKFFRTTEVDWLEAGIQLCKQGYTILQLLIHRKGLHFLHLDYNFNLKPTKTLTTKERKRSRFGHSFHLVREFLKFIKLIVDAHIQFRLGFADAYELADGLNYIFNHVGQLTGIYRYKYKVMRQIKACKDLKHIIYYEFNKDIGKGPGCGFWQPAWRVWLGFLRGTIPLLERWLGNLVTRQFEGRVSKGISKTVTKQRIDSNYDLELRAQVLHEILDMMPEALRASKSKVILEHLSEAWRCWKANLPWKVPGMPPPVEAKIQKFIQLKADNYIQTATINRDRLRRGVVVDKSIAKKNIGRLSRLWLRKEQQRQFQYLEEGPYVKPDDAVSMFTTMVEWLESRDFTPIPFPPLSYKHDVKLLVLALENLRDQYNMSARLNQQQREELALIEEAYDNPHECLSRVKKLLLTQRIFKGVEISFMDYFSHAVPVYKVDPLEKITDAYLDQYLWYEAERRSLFPNWIKPSDHENQPNLVWKWCQGINNLKDVWEYANGESTVHLQTTLENMTENIDLLLLNRLLRLVMDSNLAEYICAKMNVAINFKDMSHDNNFGLIRGYQFSAWVVQYYGLMIDLLLLGIPRAQELAGNIKSPNVFMQFEDENIEKSHPIRAYCRYFNKIYIVFKFSDEEGLDLIDDYLEQNPDPNFENVVGYNNFKSWPKDQRMKLMRHDVNLGCAIFWEIRTRIPPELCEMQWENTFASVYSSENPALLFSMLGFELRIVPRTRLESDFEFKDAAWNLTLRETHQRTAYAFLKVSNAEIDNFTHRIRQILMSSGAAAFSKIVNKWNNALLGFFAYFREAAVSTTELLDALVLNETRIHTKVKMGLNSKMPSRFPPCVFYSPKELGGLGMLSASHILIPASDLRWSKQTEGAITHFRAGMAAFDDSVIPNVFRYIPSWESEFLDSQRVWREYANKRIEALDTNQRISLEDLEDIWDRGLPRINTLFQKDRHTLAYDKGFRARTEFRQYWVPKTNVFWWVNSRHDGQLWNLNTYRTDMIQALGGIETILEHTLFKGTGFDSWEGLFWEQDGGFEDSMRFKKLTNAQRTGLSQIPNRRFTLWWSPTINRANVYVGFLVQLDLTGIFLHGKIPTLKISLIQIFRAHMWQKIHESLVIDMCQVLDQEMDALQIDSVSKEVIHPRKSYRMNSSSADILLTSSYRWNVTRPSLAHDAKDTFDFATTDKFWIDIQLRYGDYDSHDTSRYARAKFLDYTSDGISTYPSPTGLMIVVDLAYNTWDAYGNWIPGLKTLVLQAMNKMMKANPALHILRERIRKALQLYQAQADVTHLTSSNFNDIFGTSQLFVDDSMVYRVVNHKTVYNNITVKPVNGAAFVLNPKSGQLFLKIIHTSTWAGQKRLNALAKWKTAEEVALLLRSMSKQDLPKQLVITSKGLLDPLEVHMLDFPNIAIRPSELHIPFRSILNVEKISNLVNKATESKMTIFNLYDDWLESISSTTAFSRLILLLRGLNAHPAKAQLLLHPDSAIKTKENHLWPSFTPEQWVRIENELSDLILNDYAKKHDINVESLTQNEIRDIILGQPIAPPSAERQMELDRKANEANNQTLALTTTSQNVHGEQITVVTTSNYESESFMSKSSWRARMLATSSLHERSKHLYVDSADLDENQLTFVIPKNLVEGLIQVSDVRAQVAAFLFGKAPADNEMIREVRYFVIVPQLGSPTHYRLPEEQPEVEGLTLLGLIHTQVQDAKAISPADLGKFTELEWNANKIIVSAVFTPGSVTLTGFNPSNEGLEWAKTNKDYISQEPKGYTPAFGQKVQMILSDRFKGGFQVPQNDLWNYAFLNAIWNPKLKYYLKEDHPLTYFDELHRKIHFQNFAEIDDDEDVDYL